MDKMDLFKSMFELLVSMGKTFLSLWAYWLWAVVLIIIIKIVRSPRFKGKKGEKKVANTLFSLPKDKYFILNDVLLKTGEETSQIDHIVVSVYGIFVIETKNYQGMIYGSEKGYNWNQNIYGNKKSFKNPIHQNYGHIKAVESALSGYGNLPINSVIAFSDESDLHVETEDVPVVHTSELSTCIQAMSGFEKITEELVKEIYETLSEKNITDKNARKKHTSEAKYKKYAKEDKVKRGICPRCGGNLVVRHGKNGEFIGCSNYPKCRYTENL